MSYIVNYNKNTHDLYLYDADPIIQARNFANCKDEMPIAYNPNFWLNDISYGFTALDYSGYALRIRGAGVKLSGGNLSLEAFNGISGGALGFPTSPLLNQVNTGIPSGNFTITDSYRFWNNMRAPNTFPSILISPQHVIVSGHMYSGYATDAKNNSNNDYGLTYSTLIFLGKDGNTYSKKANLQFYFSNAADIDNSAGGDSEGLTIYAIDNVLGTPESIEIADNDTDYDDMALMEFDTPFTQNELEQIKIYKLVNNQGSVSIVPKFKINPQGIVTIWSGLDALGSYFDASQYNTTFNDIPFYGYADVDPATGNIVNEFPWNFPVTQNPAWQGDSLSPTFIYHPGLNETCFYCLNYTTQRIAINTNNNDPPNISYYNGLLFKIIKNYIYERIGYNICLVDYFTGTDYIEVDGNIYQKGVTLSPNIGQGGITYFYGGLTSGNTYSFLVTAKNTVGYSGYAGPTGFRTP
jgi:hypothetical protein